jgi:hypothetical protein
LKWAVVRIAGYYSKSGIIEADIFCSGEFISSLGFASYFAANDISGDHTSYYQPFLGRPPFWGVKTLDNLFSKMYPAGDCLAELYDEENLRQLLLLYGP